MLKILVRHLYRRNVALRKENTYLLTSLLKANAELWELKGGTLEKKDDKKT